MGRERSNPGSIGASRGRLRELAFQPDPAKLLAPIATYIPELAPGAATPQIQMPSHRFRVLRPDDLVVLDVLGYDLELTTGPLGPVLVPKNAKARLEVRFAFQHLGEKAFYRVEPPKPPAIPEAPQEPTDSPPIAALAAKPSRLVYDVPTGEQIEYDIAGVLSAMSRLPLRVAPLATPRPVSGTISGIGELVSLVTMPGGYVLGRTAEGLLAMTSSRSTQRSASGDVFDSRSVIAQATAVRAARSLLASETAVDLTNRPIDAAVLDLPAMRAAVEDPRSVLRGIGDLIADVIGRIPQIRQRPRAPRADETAIEAPFRLIVSPSPAGGFAHSVVPSAAPEDPKRIELWHTRLGVRKVDPADGSVRIDESRHPQRAIRAIWARDKISLPPNDDAQEGESPFRMSLNPRDRVVLVRQTSDPLITTPQPVDVDRFYLSSLGAYLDVHGRWGAAAIEAYANAGVQPIEAWDHEAMMGRDQYVRVVYPGYFFPFGHRCALIKVTERKIESATGPQAALLQRKFIVVSQPVRTYNDRKMPFRQVTLRPLVTPDIDDPLKPPPEGQGTEQLFWPMVGKRKFDFTLHCVDHDGESVRLQSPLLFVAARLPQNKSGERAADIQKKYFDDPESPIAGDGQSVSFAAGTIPGDTSFEAVTFRFNGVPGATGTLTSRPYLDHAQVVVPAMRHLAPEAPTTRVLYAQQYLDLGFDGKNKEAQVFLEVNPAKTISFGQGTDKAGGFVQPDIPVRGLSRALGTVGDIDDLINAPAAKKFNPGKFLAGVLPKLFGLFELTEILDEIGLEGAPEFITERLDRIASLLADLDALRQTITRSVQRLSEDAAGAPTAALKAQAESARAKLEAIRPQLEARVSELVAAVKSLLDLANPSAVFDVTFAVGGALTAISAQIATLRNIVREQPLPPQVKAEIERLINSLEPALAATEQVEETIDAITQFVNGIDPAGLGVRARFDWRPKLTNFPKGTSGNGSLFLVREDGLTLTVEARASGNDGVGVDVLAELREFQLNLFPDAALMRLKFDRLAFRAASGRKPEVDVVFRGIEFLGVLGFIETLKSLIPFDSFSDPPYVDVSPEGVVAGFTLGLPSIAVGVFSLENISLGADARMPFLGNEALTIGFAFCSREKPFRLTVMAIGGGGFVGVRLSPRGMVLLEMSLEAGASLSIDFGVASGSVSIMVGIYLRLEEQAGSLTGYVRIRGEVDVMGIITASITLELSLKYEFNTGKMVGRASLVIEIEVFIFSGSVTITCERRFAGSNGDPTLEQIMGVQPDGTSPAWSRYCAAFAEV